MTGLPLRHLRDDLEAVAVAAARRIHRGGTLRWVAGSARAPAWPSTAGLPVTAVVTDGSDPCVAVRAVVDPRDVVVLVGAPGTSALDELARRTRPWGASSVWFGSGGRPPSPGTVDHVVWARDEAELSDHLTRFAARTRALCDEAGPLVAAAELDGPAACVTCADEGLLAEVRTIEPGTTTVTACVEGRTAQLDTTLVGELAVHDLVLVHAGTVLARLDPPADLRS